MIIYVTKRDFERFFLFLLNTLIKKSIWFDIYFAKFLIVWQQIIETKNFMNRYIYNSQISYFDFKYLE